MAQINIDPFHSVCNERSPSAALIQQYYRPFRKLSDPYTLGGSVYENVDLPEGRYTIVEDLHLTPGAKLTLAAGTTFEFMDGVGMLVQVRLFFLFKIMFKTNCWLLVNFFFNLKMCLGGTYLSELHESFSTRDFYFKNLSFASSGKHSFGRR